MRGLCVVVLAACGRIAFDAGGDAVVDTSAIDAQPCIAAASCVAFIAAGSCHQACTGLFSHAEADAGCRAWGGCLAALDSAGEGTEVAAQNLTITGADSWIGLVQAQGSTEPAEGWGWECSAAPGPFPWSGAQPDNQVAPEQCAIMHLNFGGQVFDAPCDWVTSYICER